MYLLENYKLILVKGIGTTLSIALVSQLLSVLVSFIGVYLKSTNRKSLNSLVNTYIKIVRGIPEVVWVFIFFYGGENLLNNLFGRVGIDTYIPFNGLYIGTIVLGCIYGAYNIECLHGGLKLLDRGQAVAAYVSGLNKYQTLRYITIPQIIESSIPGLLSNWLNLLKATSVLSLIGVFDLVKVASNAGNTTKCPFFYWTIVGCFFLLVTLISRKISYVVYMRLNKQKIGAS